ncbi:hypothetical protein BCR41DRAFT_392515 [Lobosporangium transversale]|uniref:Uncharacterized protein n=1 Tax=Lobosporangium transversale TaxID=64571 RepID=A0A1Y2H0L0_9FUNG|nr:hypothetical protein BCR41DRAFT_392515 [Lobosporangium transversale]ORZ28055.1 hypothetical protein BCR41DRAFT_392515 [Lobosporangium transversale]|eukprot:XP_021885758.1 hypothetical protein BCR41DRAFT_392515 [Lobosporangium transversale]
MLSLPIVSVHVNAPLTTILAMVLQVSEDAVAAKAWALGIGEVFMYVHEQTAQQFDMLVICPRELSLADSEDAMLFDLLGYTFYISSSSFSASSFLFGRWRAYRVSVLMRYDPPDGLSLPTVGCAIAGDLLDEDGFLEMIGYDWSGERNLDLETSYYVLGEGRLVSTKA